jgi:phospholipid/cholesterol/gamma-HCH transport system substrate-binding protein
METDKRYFFEGLFIVVFTIAAAMGFVWLHFAESVSGLALGDPVKFNGVDVGSVKGFAIDPADNRLVQVDVRLRKDAPVKTDTKAMLQLKGITGVVYVELAGGSANAKTLVEATPQGRIPEIPSEKSALTAFLEQLPKIAAKFSTMEDKVNKVATDVGGLTGKLHDKFLPSDKKKTGDK